MNTVSLRINGAEVKSTKGNTILEACRELDIYIPTLCAHPDLPSSLGTCRLCIVENEGHGFPSSCLTPVSDGMIIHTESPRVKEIRVHNFKILLSNLPSPRLEHQELSRIAEHIGVREEDFPPYVSGNLPVESDEKDGKVRLSLDHNLCILCGRCIRACHDLRKTNAIDFISHNGKLKIGPARAPSFSEAGCTFCSSCVKFCPTSAFTLTKLRLNDG